MLAKQIFGASDIWRHFRSNYLDTIFIESIDRVCYISNSCCLLSNKLLVFLEICILAS